MLVYLIVMSSILFLMMGYDKYQAIKKRSRIPEIVFLVLSFLGGGIGTLLGMILFHHKTRKIKFILLIPFSILIDILLFR